MTQTITHDERRREIMEAAEKVFEASGYAAATMAAVADQAGISKGSIYNYFESKQNLFIEVCAAAFASEHASGKAILADRGLPAVERLGRLLARCPSRTAGDCGRLTCRRT